MNKTVYDSIVSYRDRYLFGEEGLQDMHIYFSRHDSIDYFTIMTDIQFSPQRKIFSSIAKRKFEFLQIPVKDVNAYLIFDREHVENLPFSFSPIQLDTLRFKYIKKNGPKIWQEVLNIISCARMNILVKESNVR